MDKLEYLSKLVDSFESYHKITLPLCAAENVISDFCKLPLGGNFQERYIMGSDHSYNSNKNFIGSDYLLPFYQMISLLFRKKI